MFTALLILAIASCVLSMLIQIVYFISVINCAKKAIDVPSSYTIYQYVKECRIAGIIFFIAAWLLGSTDIVSSDYALFANIAFALLIVGIAWVVLFFFGIISNVIIAYHKHRNKTTAWYSLGHHTYTPLIFSVIFIILSFLLKQ